MLRAAGKSYLDLLALRSGERPRRRTPSWRPASHDEVAGRAAGLHRARGGGRPVRRRDVGGRRRRARARRAFEAVVTLDLGRLDAVVAVDERSLTARVQPGLRLPEAEAPLAARGLTLGHLPQSYEWATVGGCVATRSAGQASTGYGRIDEHVRRRALRGAARGPRHAARSRHRRRAGAARAAGRLGGRARRADRGHAAGAAAAARARYEACFLARSRDGCELLRDARAGRASAPDVARLSDEEETAHRRSRWPGGAASGDARLRPAGARPGCLLVCGWEGDRRRRARAPGAPAAAARRALPAGRRPGEAWRASRFAGPHLRDDLIDRGVLVETLETAATWTRLRRGCTRRSRRAGAARRAARRLPRLAPLSDGRLAVLHRAGARRRRDDPAGQWRRGQGGGERRDRRRGRDDHPPPRRRARPRALAGGRGRRLGVEVLRAVKERLDPAGIMNPGKLLAAAPRSPGPGAAAELPEPLRDRALEHDGPGWSCPRSSPRSRPRCGAARTTSRSSSASWSRGPGGAELAVGRPGARSRAGAACAAGQPDRVGLAIAAGGHAGALDVKAMPPLWLAKMTICPWPRRRSAIRVSWPSGWNSEVRSAVGVAAARRGVGGLVGLPSESSSPPRRTSRITPTTTNARPAISSAPPRRLERGRSPRGRRAALRAGRGGARRARARPRAGAHGTLGEWSRSASASGSARARRRLATPARARAPARRPATASAAPRRPGHRAAA